MKNKFLLFASVALFAACGRGAATDEKVKADIFIEGKLNGFIAQNPTWTSSEHADDDITEKFKREVIRWSNEEQFLNELPLQLVGVRDSLISDQAVKIASFTCYNDNTRPLGSVLNFMQLQVDGIMTPDVASSLTVKQHYYLTGMMYKQGKRADVKVIKVADFKGYDLGKYLFSITKATPVK